MRWPDLSTLTRGLRASFLRFPLPCAFSLLLTALLVFLAESDFRDSEGYFRPIFLLALGFVLSLLIDLVAEAWASPTARRAALQLGGLLCLGAYGFWLLPESPDAARPTFWYSYFILLFALHLAIALTPVIAGHTSLRLWRFNLTCFLRYFFSSVNAALLFGGLALAILSVDKLFDIGIDDSAYLQLWFICAFAAHPLLFLGGIASPHTETAEETFPKPLRFTLCFIGLPVIGIYLLILYAYVLKIALQWSWPNGWVAMPIFILAVISLLTFALSLPLAEKDGWARRFHRWLFPLLLPLAIVLFLALQVRLGDYGMTINRYLGLGLALWLFALSLAYVIRPRLKIFWMPLSLLAVALFAIAGGPLGAFGWSERSQTQRLQELAGRIGIAPSVQWTPATVPTDPDDVREFRSALRYTIENFGPASLESELTGFFERYPKMVTQNPRRSSELSNKIMNWLDLNDADRPNIQFYHRGDALLTGGHDWMLQYNFSGYRGGKGQSHVFKLGDDSVEFLAHAPSGILEITVNDSPLTTVDLTAWAASVSAAYTENPSESMVPLTFDGGAAGWSFFFVLTHARLDGSGTNFESANLTVFVSAPTK